MISSDTLGLIRMITFGIAGLICSAYALSTLFGITPGLIPNWLPIAAGCVAAIAFTIAAVFAGSDSTNAALDESYHADRKTAAAAGFWGALVIGTALWLSNTGGTFQLAITLTGSAAIFLLLQVALELRGRR